MYSTSKQESIHHYEESIFAVVGGMKDYPELNQIWQNYYKDTRISYTTANSLVHELINLKVVLKTKSEISAVDRLIGFFSHCFVQKEDIRCVSD
jgi:hypothetical protein